MTDLKPVYCPPHPPEVTEVVERLTEAVDAIVPVVIEIVDAIAPLFGKLWDAYERADVPPRWVYLAAHAKKARVRKRYRMLCALRVVEAML